jgi:dihydropteroate synthase
LQALLTKISINCCGRLISLESPKVMGIINLTPDSFFKGSRVGSDQTVLNQAEKMLQDGAAFLDLGGQSTRPGADKVGVEEELKRVIPGVKQIIKEFPNAIISIDTFYGEVARQAILEGACIINDVSGGDEDPKMFEVVKELRVPYILMHKKGNPQTMQANPKYQDIVLEVCNFFSKKLNKLAEFDLADIVLDPGFGFGKNLAHNYELLNRLDVLKIFELPLLIGVSRKSMVQKVVNTDSDGALNGTSSIHQIALNKGAKILRVHDVKDAVESVKIFEALNGKFGN